MQPSNRFTVTKVRAKRTGRITFTLKLPGAGRVQVIQTVARGKQRTTFARRTLTAVRAQTLTVATTPNAQGRRLVRGRGRVVLRLEVTYTPTGGTARRVRVDRVRVPGR